MNRNWRPGAIPKNVASVLARTLDGTTNINGKHALARSYVNKNSSTSAAWSGATADLGKNRHNSTVTFADVQRSQSNVMNEPLLSMNKHKGQYRIKMNPTPYRNKNGDWVKPKNIDPVNIKLGRRSERDDAISSQSSIDIEITPQYPKSVKLK